MFLDLMRVFIALKGYFSLKSIYNLTGIVQASPQSMCAMPLCLAHSLDIVDTEFTVDGDTLHT